MGRSSYICTGLHSQGPIVWYPVAMQKVPLVEDMQLVLDRPASVGAGCQRRAHSDKRPPLDGGKASQGGGRQDGTGWGRVKQGEVRAQEGVGTVADAATKSQTPSQVVGTNTGLLGSTPAQELPTTLRAALALHCSLTLRKLPTASLALQDTVTTISVPLYTAMPRNHRIGLPSSLNVLHFGLILVH